MVGVVDLELAITPAWVVELDSLPQPPALEYGAFAIACGRRVPIDVVVSWMRHIQTERPRVPIAALINADDGSAIQALRYGLQFTRVIEQRELDQGRVPLDILEDIRNRAVEGQLLRMWSTRWNIESHERRLLTAAAAAAGVKGGHVKSLCRLLRCSSATLYRRFGKEHLPPPGELLREARLEAAEIRTTFGIKATTARNASGWDRSSAYRNARFRAREKNRDGG